MAFVIPTKQSFQLEDAMLPPNSSCFPSFMLRHYLRYDGQRGVSGRGTGPEQNPTAKEWDPGVLAVTSCLSHRVQYINPLKTSARQLQKQKYSPSESDAGYWPGQK